MGAGEISPKEVGQEAGRSRNQEMGQNIAIRYMVTIDEDFHSLKGFEF